MVNGGLATAVEANYFGTFVHIVRTLDFSASHETVATHDVFDITGDVYCLIAAKCTGNVTETAGATIVVGVTSDDDYFLGQSTPIDATALTSGQSGAGKWLFADNSGPIHARAYGSFPETSAYGVVNASEKITWTIGTQALSAGTVEVHCWYRMMTAGSSMADS